MRFLITRLIRILFCLSLLGSGSVAQAGWLQDATEWVSDRAEDLVDSVKEAWKQLRRAIGDLVSEIKGAIAQVSKEISNLRSEISKIKGLGILAPVLSFAVLAPLTVVAMPLELPTILKDVVSSVDQFAGDVAREAKRLGGDIAREWKALPPGVQIGIIVAAAAVGGYFLAPAIGAEFAFSLAIQTSGGVLTVPIATTATTGALITGIGAGAAAKMEQDRQREIREKEKEKEEKKQREETYAKAQAKLEEELAKDRTEREKLAEKQREEEAQEKTKKEREAKEKLAEKERLAQKEKAEKPQVSSEKRQAVETFITKELEKEGQELRNDQEEPIDHQGQPSSEHFCFAAGTLVRTDIGHLPIEEVTTEHRVVSCNFAGEQCTFRKVLRTLTSKTAMLIHIGLAGGASIAASPNHPFFVPERNSFVAVEELTQDNTLLNIEGETVAIQSLKTEVLAQPVTVYNLAVEEDQNYYVSSADGYSPENILVHNCNKFDCPGIASDLKAAGEATAVGGLAAGAACAGLALGCAATAVTPGGQAVAIGAACPGAASACAAALGLGAASAGAYGGAAVMHMEAEEATKGTSKVESRPSGLRARGESGGSNVENPFNLVPTHKLTMSKKAFKDFKDGIATDGHIKEPIRYVEHEGKKYIVDGHHRARAAKELGLQEVPTEKVSLPYKGYKQIEDLLGN